MDSDKENKSLKNNEIRSEDEERSNMIQKGLRKECSLFYLPFKLHIKEEIEELKEKSEGGVTIQEETIFFLILRFTDVICPFDRKLLKEISNEWI